MASVASAIAAEEGGADRLELNSALELDGLTPSLGLYHRVREACSLPIIAMIRPRAGNFCYTQHEFASMLSDIKIFEGAGVDGFAFGFLTNSFEINEDQTRQAVAAAGSCEKVFHRAFDITPSATDALEKLVELGINRVLSSGQASTALQGAPVLSKLVKQAQNRIEILPGAGIKPSNAHELLRTTGCTQIHGTFRPGFKANTNTSGLEALKAIRPPDTDANIIKQVRAAIL